MPESNIDITLRTKREGNAPQETVQDLEQMRSGLSDVEKSMAGTRTTIGGLDRDMTLFGANLGSTADLMSGLGISIPVTPMQAFGQGISAASNFIRESIGEYSAYVDQMDKLAQYTGMTVEDTSRLIQVSDDLRISTNAVEMALKTMATQGTVPSIEGLAQLSDEYLAIQDPLEQAQFLTKNFGRSGQEMARLMRMGGDAIRDTTQAVEDWMVVTGKSKEEVDSYLRTMDNWEESIMNIKYQLSSDLLPVITEVMNAMMASRKEVEESGSSWMNFLPILASARDAYLLIKNLFGSDPTDVASEETYAGGRAQGGPVGPGRVYKVGEREVEYLQVGGAGMVTPASAGGGVQIHLTYSPVVSLASRAEAEQVLVPYIQAALRQLQ